MGNHNNEGKKPQDKWKPNKAEAGPTYAGHRAGEYGTGWDADDELKQTLTTFKQTLLVSQAYDTDGHEKVTDKEKKLYLKKQLDHALSVEAFDVKVLAPESHKLMRETLETFKKLSIDESDKVLGDEVVYLKKAIEKNKGQGR